MRDTAQPHLIFVEQGYRYPHFSNKEMEAPEDCPKCQNVFELKLQAT